MRKPYYWKARNAYYVNVNRPDGKGTRSVRLSEDKDTAFAMWRAKFKPSERDPLADISPDAIYAKSERGKTARGKADGTNSRKPSRAKKQPLVGSKSQRIPARPTRKDDDQTPRLEGSRLRQLERALLIIELLAPLRHGVTLQVLATDVCDLLGVNYHDRTIHRDLLALQRLAVVEVNGCSKPARWRIADQSVHAVILAKVAELRAECDQED